MYNKNKINYQCHLEGRSARQDLSDKCRDCCEKMGQKRYRAKPFRDLYARSPNGSRLKMTVTNFSFFTPAASLLRRHSEPQAKNPEKIILDNWILRSASTPLRMTSVLTLTLSLLLSLNLSTAWADTECSSGQKLCGNDCISSSNMCFTCGANCGAYYTGGKITFSGSGDMTNFKNTNVPWINYGLQYSITNFEIKDGITSISDYTFLNMSNISGTFTIPDSVTRIGKEAFSGANHINSLTIPDSVNSIGLAAFAGMHRLTDLVIPDVWGEEGVEFNDSMFAYSCVGVNKPSGCLGNTKIVCQGNKTKCQTSLSKFLPGGSACTSDSKNCISSDSIISVAEAVANGGDVGKLCNSGMYEWDTATSTCKRLDSSACNQTTKYYYNTTSNQCQVLPKTQSACTGTDVEWDSTNSKCINKNAITAPAGDPVTPVEETPQQVTAASCAADGKVLQGKECVSSCGPSFKYNDGECDRVRYTPAEAAAVLHDDNTNIVTITFKK